MGLTPESFQEKDFLVAELSNLEEDHVPVDKQYNKWRSQNSNNM
jgi:hypothetical protein